MLPPDVQLRIKCNVLLSTALKFAWPFTIPVPFTTEQNALVCLCKPLTPKIIIRITIQYGDVQGIASQQINIGTEYTIKKITATDTTRHPGATFDFMNSGKVIQRFGASQIDISDKPKDSHRVEARAMIDRIEAQQVIASVWLHSNMLASVFPIRKVKDEQDKQITITPSGITIAGIIDGKEALLSLSCEPNASSGIDYGFNIMPKSSLNGNLIMAGLSQLGRFTSTAATGGITFTFYDKLESSYYLRIEVPFSQMSSGAVYLAIASTPKSLLLPPSLSTSGLRTIQDAGDQAPAFSPLTDFSKFGASTYGFASAGRSAEAPTAFSPSQFSSSAALPGVSSTAEGQTIIPGNVNFVPPSSLDFGEEDVDFEESDGETKSSTKNSDEDR
jgi:hypothetical protein